MSVTGICRSFGRGARAFILLNLFVLPGADDRAGAAASSEIRSAPEDPSIRILAVGSNRSFKSGLKPLRFAGSDATRFGHVMAEVGLVQPEAVSIVSDPSVSELRRALQQFAVRPGSASPSSLQKFIFYFSGHSDADGIHLRDGAISKAELHRSLAGVKSRSKIAILDSCFSGSLAAKGIAPDSAFEIPKAQFDEPSGSVFLAAASENQFAFESDTYHGSVFTHHLVKGLYGDADGNGDGVVTVDELYQHVYRLTRIQALTGPTRQEPSMAADLKGRGAIAMSFPSISMGKLSMASDVSGVVTFASSRGLQTFQVEKAAGQDKTVRLPAGDFTVSVRDGSAVGSAQIAVRPSQKAIIRLADISWSNGSGMGAGSAAAKGAGPGSSMTAETSPTMPSVTIRSSESETSSRFARDMFAGIHNGYSQDRQSHRGPMAGLAGYWTWFGHGTRISAGPGGECQIHQGTVGKKSEDPTGYRSQTAALSTFGLLGNSNSVTTGACYVTLQSRALAGPAAMQVIGGLGQTLHLASGGRTAAGPGGVARARFGSASGLGVWIQGDWTRFKTSPDSIGEESFTAWSGGIAYQY